MKLHELKPFAAGLMAAAMMFSSCGSDDEGTPDPGPGPEPEEIFLPELTVSLVDGFQSTEMNSTADHLYLHADSVQLVLSWEKEADKKYATMGDLSLKMGDETYALTATDNGFETAVLRDDFNDAYLTDFDLLAEAPVEDEEYEGEEEKVSLDFTLTTGKFGSVVFTGLNNHDYRYSTVLINDLIWMAENLRSETTRTAHPDFGYGDDFKIDGQEYQDVFGHLYGHEELGLLQDSVEVDEWFLPPSNSGVVELYKYLGGTEDDSSTEINPSYSGVEFKLQTSNSKFWDFSDDDEYDFSGTNESGLNFLGGGYIGYSGMQGFLKQSSIWVNDEESWYNELSDAILIIEKNRARVTHNGKRSGQSNIRFVKSNN